MRQMTVIWDGQRKNHITVVPGLGSKNEERGKYTGKRFQAKYALLSPFGEPYIYIFLHVYF